jgi:hypothetical protein
MVVSLVVVTEVCVLLISPEFRAQLYSHDHWNATRIPVIMRIKKPHADSMWPFLSIVKCERQLAFNYRFHCAPLQVSSVFALYRAHLHELD